MSQFAIIKDNKVFNVVVAESLELLQSTTDLVCFEITQSNPAETGWDYNPTTKKAIIPEPVIPSQE